MDNVIPIHHGQRPRGQLADAALTPEQHAAIEARRADRPTLAYQEELVRDIEAYQQEYPPGGDPELSAALDGLRRVREQQGLSLTDMSRRTGMDRATISKLETGRIANPTVATLRNYARALGRKLTWTLEEAEVGKP